MPGKLQSSSGKLTIILDNLRLQLAESTVAERQVY